MDLPSEIENHRMVASNDQRELFIVGGYDGNFRSTSRKQILELKCSGLTPDSCHFEDISGIRLRYARDFHIALPIDESLARDLCN